MFSPIRSWLRRASDWVVSKLPWTQREHKSKLDRRKKQLQLNDDEAQERIFHGWQLEPHEFPWMVKIKVSPLSFVSYHSVVILDMQSLYTL